MNIKHTVIELLQVVLLAAVLIVAAIFFQQTGDMMQRFMIVVAVAVIYVGWGIWHHRHNDRFDKWIFFEYFLVASIVVLLYALGTGMIRFL